MYRWSDASYLESQDMLRMSGIEREVYIYARPNYWRPPTDNYLDNEMLNWAQIWKETSLGLVPVLLKELAFRFFRTGICPW
jgi:beta-galactosidase/beta-glucuronidase